MSVLEPSAKRHRSTVFMYVPLSRIRDARDEYTGQPRSETHTSVLGRVTRFAKGGPRAFVLVDALRPTCADRSPRRTGDGTHERPVITTEELRQAVRVHASEALRKLSWHAPRREQISTTAFGTPNRRPGTGSRVVLCSVLRSLWRASD